MVCIGTFIQTCLLYTQAEPIGFLQSNAFTTHLRKCFCFLKAFLPNSDEIHVQGISSFPSMVTLLSNMQNKWWIHFFPVTAPDYFISFTEPEWKLEREKGGKGRQRGSETGKGDEKETERDLYVAREGEACWVMSNVAPRTIRVSILLCVPTWCIERAVGAAVIRPFQPLIGEH